MAQPAPALWLGLGLFGLSSTRVGNQGHREGSMSDHNCNLQRLCNSELLALTQDGTPPTSRKRAENERIFSNTELLFLRLIIHYFKCPLIPSWDHKGRQVQNHQESQSSDTVTGSVPHRNPSHSLACGSHGQLLYLCVCMCVCVCVSIWCWSLNPGPSH